MMSFIKKVVTHFIKDDCSYRAGALAFSSLLTVVPLMSVSLTVLSAFPLFKKMNKPLQDFIFENFVPETGKLLQSHLHVITQQATKLSITGTLFLIVSVLLMLITIERSMNQIFEVKRARKGVAAISLYAVLIFIAPLLIALSFSFSTYFLSLTVVSAPLRLILATKAGVLHVFSIIFAMVTFAILFKIIPNTKVKWSHAFIGALISALLFQSAKALFTWYLKRFHTYELLYGAFAFVPIFFLWVYWVWLIVLLGAEVTYVLGE